MTDSSFNIGDLVVFPVVPGYAAGWVVQVGRGTMSGDVLLLVEWLWSSDDRDIPPRTRGSVVGYSATVLCSVEDFGVAVWDDELVLI